jgi:hypothetical protein
MNLISVINIIGLTALVMSVAHIIVFITFLMKPADSGAANGRGGDKEREGQEKRVTKRARDQKTESEGVTAIIQL